MPVIDVVAMQVPEYSFSVSLWIRHTLVSVCLYRPMEWHWRHWRRLHGAWLLALGPISIRYNRTQAKWYRLSVRRFHTTVYKPERIT